MLDEVDAANRSGMTARDFAKSKGVPSTMTDAEAAAADMYDLRLKSEGEGKLTSPDKYVGETANAIEAEFPGRVIGVDKKVYKPDGSLRTDYDIELDNIVIQIKSGSGKKLTSQMKRTQAGTDKIVIGYTPDLNPSSALIKGAKEAGFEVFTTWEDLLAYLRTH